MASPLSLQQPQQQYESPSPALSTRLSTKHSSDPLDDHSANTPITMQHDSMVTVRLSEPPTISVKTSFGPDSIPPPGKSLLANDGTPINVTPTHGTPREYVPRAAMAECVKEEDEEDEGTVTAEEAPKKSLEEELQEGKTSQTDASYSDSEEVNWDQLQKTEHEHSQKPEADNATAMLLARLEQENSKLTTNPKNVIVQSPQRQSIRRARPPSMAQMRQMVTDPTPPALRYSMLPPPPMTDLEFYAALVKDYEQTVARLPTLVASKVRKGIPPPLRGVVWASMSRARDVALEETYDRLGDESSPFESTIGKDLGRTFPGVDMFRDPDGDGQRMLGRVLKCFSLYDPEIGYCQGLAFIVGPLLMHMPDKQAFCILVRLMEHYDIRSCFLPEMPGLLVRVYQFSELLRRNVPALWSHFRDLQIEPIYVSQWFLSFFAVTCPLPMLFRIYDVLFAEGASETIMRVALSLMRKNEARILGCTEIEEVMPLLLSRGLWDCYHYNGDEFVDDFVQFSTAVTGDILKEIETQYHRENETQSTSSSTTDTGQIAVGALLQSSPSHLAATSSSMSNDAHRSTQNTTAAASQFLGRLWASTGAPATKAATPPIPAAGANNASSTSHLNNTTPLSSSAAASTSTSPPKNNNANFSSSSPSSSSPSPSSTRSVPNTNNSTTTTLSPRPMSMLKRSASKQSLASTLNSMEASSSSVVSTASTDATSLSRDSSNTDDSSTIDAPSTSTRSNAAAASARKNSTTLAGSSNSDTKYLNSQIEDLLLALTELQRNNALLADQLQREREERDEDKKAVTSLLDGLSGATESEGDGSAEQLPQLVEAVQQKFGFEGRQRQSTSPTETKSQLREDLERAKERLATEESRGQEGKRRILDLQQDVTSLKEQVRESREHVRVLHGDKQRLEKQIHDLRVRASTEATPDAGGDGRMNRQSNVSVLGLREFKLNRSRSTPSQAGQVTKRTSSIPRTAGSGGGGGGGGATENGVSVTPVSAPANEYEALLLELVQAKTAEAMATQEADEMRGKLEKLRREVGMGSSTTTAGQGGDHGSTQVTQAAAVATTAASTAANAAMGVFGRLTGGETQKVGLGAPARSNSNPTTTAAPAATSAVGAGGGFWGWRR